jgi:hypothetical protein
MSESDIQDAIARRVSTTTITTHPSEPTIRSTWLAASGRPASSELLEWPADVFALTTLITDRTEAYRFVISPPPGGTWPPELPAAAWSDQVRSAAQAWAERAGEGTMEPPDLVRDEWQVVREALDTSLDDIASGRAWRACSALLTLHAIADEACADVAAGTLERREGGIVLRARTRELLARTGSMARVDAALLRVVPKYRTANGGITAGSISRYASLVQTRVGYNVRRTAPARPPGALKQGLNALLLPWPLRVTETDFQPVGQSVRERDTEPFGLFRYQPSESFDVALVDRLLASASEHVDRVDVVVAPESSVPHELLPQLEAALSQRGVAMLVAGMRDRPDPETGLASNWVHFGLSRNGSWWRYRQDKHHRWSLDQSQIEQYHLTQMLDPRVRWWEAIEIRRRSLQIFEGDDGLAIASLLCEDIAQIDDAAQLIRAVGPTLVIALLLDGPQLASRWTGRYASLLADDPGSAVLTLTSHGMATGARPAGAEPSTAVALWTDSTRRRPQEINLEPGAQGLLLRLETGRAIRRAADGREPELNAADIRLAEVDQLRAGPTVHTLPATDAEEPSLSADDLTVLQSWAEAIDDARAAQPNAVHAVASNARPGASWRAALNLPQPTGALFAALCVLGS